MSVKDEAATVSINVFKTLTKIYDEAFLRKQLTATNRLDYICHGWLKTVDHFCKKASS